MKRIVAPRRPLGVRFGRTVIAIEIALALAFCGYLLHHEGVRLPFSSGPYVLHARFADAGGLRSGEDTAVTIAGVPSGEVGNVDYRNGVAIVTLNLDPSTAGKLRAGARAEIVPRSALQDMTVDIDPGRGGAPALAEGVTLPVARTSTAVSSDRVVDVLDADTRSQVAVLAEELAQGLNGRAPATLRADLSRLAHTSGAALPVTTALASRRHELARFVGQLDAIFRQLSQRQLQLADAIAAGRRTLAVTGGREQALAGTMQSLPSALSSTTAALGATQRLGAELDPSLVALRGFARRLPGAERAARAVVPAASRLLSNLGAFERSEGGAVGDLAAAASGLGPASQAIRSPVARMLPLLRAINRHRQGIGELGDRFSGVFSTADANGPILRGLGFFEPFDPADLGFGSTKASSTLAAVDAVAALRKVCLETDPVACLVRYLVPGLPGGLTSKSPLAAAPSGEARR